MQRHRNKTAIVLIVLALVAYVANLAIDNPYTHSLVNYYVNERFLTQLPIRAEYQSMRLQLFPPEIQLFGVKVSTKQTDQASIELLSSSQVSFKVGLWSLLLAKPQIGDLELHDLNAAWPPPPELMAALKALEPKNPHQKSDTPAAWPPAQDPPLSSLTIHNAALRIRLDGIALNAEQDPKEITTITTEGTELQIDFRGWREIKIATSIQRLNLADRGTSYLEDANLSLSGTLRGGKFASNQFSVQSPRLSSNGNLDIELVVKGNERLINNLIIDGNIDTHLDFSLLGSFLDLSGTRGMVRGKAHYNVGIPILENKPTTLDVKGTVVSENAAMSDFHLYQSEADFNIDMDGMTFNEVRIKSQDKTFAKGKGKLLFNEEIGYDFHLKPDGLPLDMLLGVFNVPFDFLNFKLNSEDLSIKGRGDPFLMAVTSDTTLKDLNLPNITYDHTKYPKPPQCKLALNLAINIHEINFDGSNGFCQTLDPERKESFPLIISGVTTFNDKQGMNLSFTAPQEFNPATLKYFSQTDLSGSGRMTTRVHGSYSDIRISTDIDMNSFSFGKTELGRLSAKTEIVGDQLAWKGLSMTLPEGGSIASPTGTLQLDDSLTAKTEIHAVDIDELTIESFLKEFSGPQSQLSFNIDRLDSKFFGDFRKPLLNQGDTTFELSSIIDGAEEYASTLGATIHSSSEGLKIIDGKYEIGTFFANFDGNLTRSGPMDENFLGGIGISKNDKVEINISAATTKTTDDQIQRIPFISEMAKKAQITGVVSGSSKLTGTLNKLSGLAKVQVDQLHVMNASMPSLTSTVLVDGLKLDIMAEQGGNALKGRINLDLGSETMPYNWYLTAKNFDFRPFMPDVIAKDPRNFAYFSGSWSMQGNLNHWWASSGELDVKRIRAKYHPAQRVAVKPVEIATIAPTKIIMSKNGWTFADGSSLKLNSDVGSLVLDFGDNRLPDHIDITTSGRLKIEALKMLSSEIETATGNVSFEGGITGSFADPNVDILFTDDENSTIKVDPSWEPVAIGLAGYRPALKDIQLRARLRNSSIQVETLHATKGSGTISMDGLFAFPNKKAAQTDLNLNMENATFVYPFPIVKNFDTTLNSNLRITGQNFPLQVSGTIDVKRARSNREIDIRQAILESIRSSSSQTGPQTLQPNVLLDIRIAAAESISFNSRNAQATLSSNLHLSGTDLAPEVSGLIEVNRGRFFYKRDFNIQRGLINYDDPVKPDPSLDISAVSEVGGYRVNIGITGKASAPVIDFAVDPPTRPDGTPITKLEIITLLNRGSLPDLKLNGTSTAESTAAAEALNLLAGQVEDTVEKIFDISGQNVIRQVYIDTYAGTDGTPIARFNLPLNITEDLDVILKVDQNTVKLSSEYTLHDSISVTGGIESSNETTSTAAQQQGTPADTGVDLKFKFAFP